MADKEEILEKKVQLKILKTALCNFIKDKGHKEAADKLESAVDRVLLENTPSENVEIIDLERSDKILDGMRKSLASAKKSLEELFSGKIDPLLGSTAVNLQVDIRISEIEKISGIKRNR